MRHFIFHSVHIQTLGLEATQLSMLMKMHHPHIPYFALQQSGCVFIPMGPILGESSASVEHLTASWMALGAFWQDYRKSVHFRTAFISSQKYMGFIWPVEFNSSISFHF